MVFDPTFHEIGREADELPDLAGDEPDEVDDDLLEGDETDDLPPLGGA
jgi:hypothetical protein